ncbi:hypothetical protein JVU11DRAFT_11039 [Chiua virens]|nr:hypothetical protein JVU11DRAFT_11039 [Chiua virens]
MRLPNWSKRTVLELIQTRSDLARIKETRYDLFFALPSLLFPLTTEYLSVLDSDYLRVAVLHAPTLLASENIPTTPSFSIFPGTRVLHVAIAIQRPAAIVTLAFCLASISHANNVLENIISVVDIGYIISDCGAIATLIIDEKHELAFDEIASILPQEYISTNEVDGRRFSLVFNPGNAEYMTSRNFIQTLVEISGVLGFE